MADLALVTAGKVEVVESVVQDSMIAAEAIAAGQAVRIDVANGKATKANGTTAAEARIYGVALKAAAAGAPVTVLRLGVLDGFDISGMTYDDDVFLSDTDGTLADAAGTVSTIVGKVIGAHAVSVGTALDQLMFVNCL
jgi:hypothetical protein